MAESDLDAKRISLLDVIKSQSDTGEVLTRMTLCAAAEDVLLPHTASRLSGAVHACQCDENQKMLHPTAPQHSHVTEMV